MNFLIPNSVADQLVCDSCFKFLSVIPVKIYADKKILCGRCSLKNDGGVISLYNTIIEKTIFGCVNRFDGCKELLSTVDVLKHEQVCKPAVHTCPICCQRIPTFLMIAHFEAYHKKNILKSSYLQGDLESKEDFFLYQYNGLGNFKLCTFTFNNLDRTQVNKYDVLCPQYPSFEKTTLYLQKNYTLYVGFFVTYLESQYETLIRLPQRYSLPQPEEIANEEEKVIYSIGLKVVSTYFQERDIVISDVFQTKYPDVSIVQGCTIKCKISNENICVSLSCCLCSQIFLTEGNLIYFCEMNGQYHLACFSCRKFLNRPNKELFPIVTLNEISYFCKWDCGKFFPLTQLKTHEETCEIQPPQLCPVSYCSNYFKIFEIIPHFKNKHIDLVQPIFINVYGSEVFLDLDPHASPIKRYFLIPPAYIYVEFVWTKPFWNIFLSCKLPKVSPRALIFSHDRMFKYLIEKKGSIRHINRLGIKCYLAHPEREY